MTHVAQVVDRHAAHVHAHLAGSMGLKTPARRQGVVDAQGHRLEKRDSGLGAIQCRRPLGRIEIQYSGRVACIDGADYQ